MLKCFGFIKNKNIIIVKATKYCVVITYTINGETITDCMPASEYKQSLEATKLFL